ncbi:MAG: aspartate/glutamate racemase family protein [Thaumarchaeota archaeon]|nr:aspartate/glutamate racemase family protein [Nitrososphaerota archaeon]MBI3642289.1 aspartate/glutamate racemase family protein [Nitrososphaerota archaeon]
MVKIAVFDSGLGSLSIIKPIQKKVIANIIYFADQKNFPYGKKSVLQLEKIIKSTIEMLDKNFSPNLIVIGSNTPSLLLKKIFKKPRIIGVFPPLKDAKRKTKTKTIAILSTKSIIESNVLQNYIKKNIPEKIKVIKINASPLVDLVESGKFIDNKKLCRNKIKKILSKPFIQNHVDVATLSSTHLPFLLPFLKEIFPNIIFIDPGNNVAEEIAKKLRHQNKTKSLIIFASGNIQVLQKKLSKIGIKNKVRAL